MKKGRLEAITDAILAIIITIMVLEIKLPEISIENIPDILQLIFIYAISFIYISILWINHHHIFTNIEHVSLNIVWINFGLLFFTSLLPKATERLSENFHHVGNHIFFAAIMTCTTLVYTIIQQQIMKNENTFSKTNVRNWIAVALFVSSIPLSFWSIYLSGCIFTVIPFMYFLISNKIIK